MAITVTGGPAYGLSWNKTTDAYARVASAAGLTAGANFNSPSGGAWGLRRCNLWDDGTPTAYYGDRCYTDTDIANMGQAMVQIPKFYYYMEYNAGTTTYYWFVTTVAATTIDVGLGVGAQAVKLHPAFSRNSVTKNQVYLGAYEGYFDGATKIQSKSGVTPVANQLLSSFFRPYAENRGTGWEIQDYLTTCAVQLLYLIEYASFNAQLNIGYGNTSAAGPLNTGATTAYGNASYGTTADKTHAMSYRGIENFYGNLHKQIDGLNLKADYMPWVADHGFVSNTFAAPYLDTGFTLPNVWAQYITDIQHSATYDYGFLPLAASGGSATTYLCDTFSASPANNNLIFGGTYNSDTAAGPFFWFTYNLNSATIGARLEYIG